MIGQTCQEEAGLLSPLTPTPLNTPTRPHPLSFLGPVEEKVNEDHTQDIAEVEFEGVVDHESEDRLDQLLMEDGLSDAHIEAVAKMAELEEQKCNSTSLVEEEEEGVTREEGARNEEEANISSSGVVGGNGVLTTVECQELLLQCHESLSVVCDVLHSRCTKILSIRAKVSSSSAPPTPAPPPASVGLYLKIIPPSILCLSVCHMRLSVYVLYLSFSTTF